MTSETFRDRISPGAVETWTFKVINQNDEGVKAAMLFDMYNSALNGVGSSQWKAPLFLKPSLRNLDLNHNNFGKGHNILYSKIANSRCNPPSCPIFNTYDQILGHASIPSFRVVGYGVVAAAPQSRMAKAELKEESADLAMDMAANNAGHVLAAEAVQEALPAPPFSYRDSEVALAFFRPSVTTDNQGNASLTFTVPNANTSWTFNTFAFTPDLTSTSFYCDVISSKPVMVQPNLPRFLRSGDKAVIRAAVMNNSDRTSEITTTIELFNPVNGDIIKTATSTASLAAGADTTAVITVDTPLDCSMIGYRVKSSDKSFADGEQNIIPVLPATQPVLETYPFYMAPDSASYHGEIPARPADARVTMTFCENPVWEVVTALPGLLKDEAMTAPDAAEAIFSACVAEGILRDNPAIATELHRWLTSDRSDSTLVSMLSRNSDLKTFVLSATPWVQAAESDTERMTRLALLFDRKTIDNAIDANLTLLKKLQMPSGAFRWMQQSYYPSQWATSRVLCLLGTLGEMGHLPKDKRVQPMIKSALEWLDTEVVKDYRRYPDGDFSSWTYLHTFYPKASTTASARRVINATVQRLVSGWKDENVPGKAKAAIILNANGYSSTASQVLKSLREYSVYSPERGMHWPSLDNLGFFSAYTKVSATAFALDAFRTVEPGCADIDRIRQWLILQKEAQDWATPPRPRPPSPQFSIRPDASSSPPAAPSSLSAGTRLSPTHSSAPPARSAPTSRPSPPPSAQTSTLSVPATLPHGAQSTSSTSARWPASRPRRATTSRLKSSSIASRPTARASMPSTPPTSLWVTLSRSNFSSSVNATSTMSPSRTAVRHVSSPSSSFRVPSGARVSASTAKTAMLPPTSS